MVAVSLREAWLARPERIELPTCWFEANRSIRLSYGRARLSLYELRRSLAHLLFTGARQPISNVSMEYVNVTSQFLPAQRLSRSEVDDLASRLAEWQPLETLFQNHPQPLALLTEQRQVVWANHALARLAGVANGSDLAGLRTGEALGCVNAHLETGGCGTSRNCRSCKIANAVMDALCWESAEASTTIWLERDGDILPLALQVTFTSVFAIGTRLLLCRFRDSGAPLHWERIPGQPPAEVAELYNLIAAQPAVSTR